ncbi:hypothetical protein ROZALSC1DRAFT_25240 [Rozella allomycis CSF55]|uniref:Uncharacterized protein n=1 Tax=Rozella allomycis (strain CSF55) TaxID=988480 RepID=A0A4P9YBE4_ROZAC|nr:hypothetical protein ROZALSC1DRAFT_25240 [Rozella allomycis CSF55]
MENPMVMGSISGFKIPTIICHIIIFIKLKPKHGYGLYITENGRMYEGEFRDDNMAGVTELEYSQDCHLDYPLATLNRIISKAFKKSTHFEQRFNDPHNPREELIFFDFLQSLVSVSYYIFQTLVDENEVSIYASRFNYFIKNILSSLSRASDGERKGSELATRYISKDYGILVPSNPLKKGLFTINKVLECLKDVVAIARDDSYNLDYEIISEELLQILIECALLMVQVKTSVAGSVTNSHLNLKDENKTNITISFPDESMNFKRRNSFKNPAIVLNEDSGPEVSSNTHIAAPTTIKPAPKKPIKSETTMNKNLKKDLKSNEPPIKANNLEKTKEKPPIIATESLSEIRVESVPVTPAPPLLPTLESELEPGEIFQGFFDVLFKEFEEDKVKMKIIGTLK